MKRKVYSLADEPFVMFSANIGDVLRDKKVPHNIVGGVATQTYLLDMLTKKYDCTVRDLVLRDAGDKIRLQDYLRSTDDVDVALDLRGDDKEKIRYITTKLLPEFRMNDISPSEESTVEIRRARRGASRPTFRVYVDGDEGTGEEIIAMNISRGQEKDLHDLDSDWYLKFIEQGKEINLPYSDNFSPKFKIPRIEHLLATKIAQSRAKDAMDLRNLVDLARDTELSVDYNEIKKVLLPDHEERYNKFLYDIKQES